MDCRFLFWREASKRHRSALDGRAAPRAFAAGVSEPSNSSQLYFGQPARVWRLVPGPKGAPLRCKRAMKSVATNLSACLLLLGVAAARALALNDYSLTLDRFQQELNPGEKDIG